MHDVSCLQSGIHDGADSDSGPLIRLKGLTQAIPQIDIVLCLLLSLVAQSSSS